MKSETTDPQETFNLASKAVSDAVEYDNKHNYKEAHALYVKAVGLFEESMEAESNETKLSVLKNRIAAYKKRAAELDSFLKASNMKSAAPVRINDIEFDLGGILKTFPDAGEGQATSKVNNEHRLERMVCGLGVLVGVLLMSVIALFVLLHVHIANTSDYVTTNELEVTQANLNTLANAVLRMSTSDATLEAQSGDTVFNDLENIISCDVQVVTAKIEELKVQLASVHAVLDAKADHASVYTVESIDAFISSLMTKAEAASNMEELAQVKEGLETRLNEVDVRLSSEISGISGSVNELSKTVGSLSGEVETVGTTSADAVQDLETLLNELNTDVEALENGMVLKADAEAVNILSESLILKADAEAVNFLSESLKDKADKAFVEALNVKLVHVDGEVVKSSALLATKVNETQAATMIASAVRGLNMPSILASISAVAADVDAEKTARIKEDSFKVSGVAYDLKMADLDKKIILLNNAILPPVKCTWTGQKEVFADGGCADDLLMFCANGYLTKVQTRC